MAEILIVDDERVIREGLKATLQGEGFAVRTARDGGEALVKIAEKRPDLVLLDVMMPKKNGFCCCEEIRKTDALLPVVFLSAKESESDRIRAAGLEADDYVFKSASGALLVASVNRALARAAARSARAAEDDGGLIRLGKVTVDLRLLVVSEDGAEVSRLTKTEADILRCLTEARGALVTIDALIAYLRGNGYACEDAMLYTHISRLRGKIGKAGALIMTTRGVGYQILR